jgi:hypothetical protein
MDAHEVARAAVNRWNGGPAATSLTALEQEIAAAVAQARREALNSVRPMMEWICGELCSGKAGCGTTFALAIAAKWDTLLAAAPGGGHGEGEGSGVVCSPAEGAGDIPGCAAPSSPPAPFDARYEPYYVCAECDEDTSGHAAADLRVRPDGDLICECCCDALDDECPRWEDLPAFCPSAPPATSRVEDRDARVARGAEALIRHSCRAWNFNQACEMARMILAAAEAAPTPAHSRIDALRAAWITAEEQRCCCPAGEHALYVRLCAVAREAWQDYIEARDANEGRMP